MRSTASRIVDQECLQMEQELKGSREETGNFTVRLKVRKKFISYINS